MTESDANYEVKEQSVNEVTVQVTVVAAAVKNGVNAIYRRYEREVQIPGFRKGHVPRSFIDARFGRKMFLEEAQNDLKKEHLQQAFTSLELRPVTTPQISVVSDEEGKEFVFTASFSILPTFALPEYRGIELAVEPEKTIGKDDIQETLEQIRVRYATTVTKDGGVVAEGDIVHIKDDGGEDWKEYVYKDEDSVIVKLVGSKIGDTIEVDLPGEDAKRISLTILGVEERVLPDVNEDLAKTVGFGSLAALEDDIKENLTENAAQDRKRKIRTALLDRLVEQTEIPLPAAFVAEIAKEDVEKMKKEFVERSISFKERLEEMEKSEDGILAEQQVIVDARLQRELLLQKIAEKEGIAIDDDEVEKLARAEAVKAQKDPLRFVAHIKANDRWEEYRTAIVNSRVVDILYNEAKFTEGEG